MPGSSPPLKGSWRLGAFAGIGVYVHWTFFLLPALLAAAELMKAGPIQDRLLAAGQSVLLVLATFTCVVLHEFGHALTAQRFGVRTRDIVLLPIGGVARLERIPREPVQELWIALAGPAVNVVIALLIAVVLLAIGLIRGDLAAAFPLQGPVGFLAMLGAVNVVLVVFNMIPAFPMDGGRVLRAVLALRFDYGRATDIAARIGQLIALLFVAIALTTGQFMLLLVAAMVFMGAGAEARQSALLTRLAGVRVSDAMMTEFHTVSSDTPIAACAELLLAGSQRDFPVVDPGDGEHPSLYLGVLSRERIIQAMHSGAGSEAARDHAERSSPILEEASPASEALESMQAADAAAAPVVRDGRIIGLVTIENIAELLELRSSGSRPRNAHAS